MNNSPERAEPTQEEQLVQEAVRFGAGPTAERLTLLVAEPSMKSWLALVALDCRLRESGDPKATSLLATVHEGAAPLLSDNLEQKDYTPPGDFDFTGCFSAVAVF